MRENTYEGTCLADRSVSTPPNTRLTFLLHSQDIITVSPSWTSIVVPAAAMARVRLAAVSAFKAGFFLSQEFNVLCRR